MFDFRLKVFYTVASRLSFTRAAEELYITQPAVTKHIQEIEQALKVQLFERNGTRIKLTKAGEVLLQYAGKIFDTYRELEYELNILQQRIKGTLRIGASTTNAQYVLPPALAAFHDKLSDIKVSLTTGNTSQIERLLEEGEIDMGVIEGKSRSKSFRYTPLVKDEIVLVAAAGHPLVKKGVIRPEELRALPLLLREQGSGTLEVIAYHLKKAGIRLTQLHMAMELSSSESIKNYLLHSDCVAFLSVHAILKELQHRELAIIDVKGLHIERDFYIIRQQGDSDPLCELFIRFALRYNFR